MAHEFTMRVDLSNDAFQPHPATELALGTLPLVRGHLLSGATSGKIRDLNGNTVGEWEIKHAP